MSIFKYNPSIHDRHEFSDMHVLQGFTQFIHYYNLISTYWLFSHFVTHFLFDFCKISLFSQLKQLLSISPFSQVLHYLLQGSHSNVFEFTNLPFSHFVHIFSCEHSKHIGLHGLHYYVRGSLYYFLSQFSTHFLIEGYK
jgi:hypothetical protein